MTAPTAPFAPPRVVVGVDGSPGADRALRWAADEAALRGATLEVVHGWVPPYPIGPHDLFDDYAPVEEAAHRELLDRVARVRAEVPGVPEVREKLALQHPAEALLAAADGADLLVVGTRGRGGFTGLLLGSVSQRCLTHATCPVAVIPPGTPHARSGQVVCGIDGSAPALAALRWAAAEAQRRDARLDLVNAWTVPELLVPMGGAYVGDSEALEEGSRKLLESTRSILTGAADDPDAKPVDIELHSLAGTAVPCLLRAAEGADLLVLGARGLGAFRGLLLGSVSQQCTQHAVCPTVVVRQGAADKKRDRTGPQEGA